MFVLNSQKNEILKLNPQQVMCRYASDINTILLDFD